MIVWRIRFDHSDIMPATAYGYQVMTEDLVAVGLFDADGRSVTDGVSYTTVDTAPADLPDWVSILNV